MTQMQLNTIKTCIVIALIFISSIIFFVLFSNYMSMQKVEDIQSDINNTIAEYKEKFENAPKEDPKENITLPEEPEIIITEEPEITNLEVMSLLEINKDTVGWLKVNNTNVDYPVVQTIDNEYYLKKNFKNQKDSSGWIFMDYRNDTATLNKNTIIYGHNMYYSGVMFGTLYKVKHSNWYLNPENQIIEFDTLYSKMKWQIFSIYNIPNTNDYLTVNFKTPDMFQDFINLITNRSIYIFNTPVSKNDKILTLSTCSNNGKNRLVIHAVLISDNEN